jgi:hypothetical protein
MLIVTAYSDEKQAKNWMGLTALEVVAVQEGRLRS